MIAMRRNAVVVIAVIAAIAVVAIGVLVWLARGPLAFAGGSTIALADYHEANPTGVPADLAKADIVKRGEYLTKAADCMVCHTAPGDAAYAGGLAFPLPFGTLYSTNITADKDTGIGNYSDAEFLNAVRRGIRKDGARLYPAMSYTSYTFMTDADVLAVKAYLFSLPAEQKQNRPDTLSFPFNQRWTMIFWSWAFNPNTRFAPNTAQSAEWNRGAYIAEALAHCGECHTPRNLAFALNNHRKFAGAVAAGWRAYDITSDKGTGIGSWSDEDVFAYLAKGHAMGRGTASGLWARRSITASVRWRRRISGRLWFICAAFPPSRPRNRRRSQRRRRHRRKRVGRAPMRSAGRCSRRPAPVAIAGPA
jgi:mono/diheme cytochrome c family protein